MRLLHTSDWHLGVSMNDASCEPEQRRFLDWLVETIQHREIEVLVVAGDIFHFRQPANSAEKLYYDFLRRCSDETDLRQVVVTAGNHDSPSGLESPGRILETLDVTVVGKLDSDDDLDEQCLVPVRGDSGDVELVVCAIPYVRAAQLGVSGIDGDPEEVRRAFEEAFADLYTHLADTARRRWGDVSLVATGHLTCGGERESPDEDDYNTPIHSVGTIDAMRASMFDDRYDYVALGHIHRAFPVEKPRIWYSGTPVPTAQTETSTRYVVDVEFSGDQPECELLKVPRWRDIHQLEGTVDEVVDEFTALTTDGDLPPYLFIHIRDDDFDYEDPVFDRLQNIRRDFDEPRPRIVEFRMTDTGGFDETAEAPEQLDELRPEEVFVRLYQSRHDNQSPDVELLRAFRQLLPKGPDPEQEKSDAPSQASLALEED